MLLKPSSILWFSFVGEYSFQTDRWLSFKRQECHSDCDAVVFGFKVKNKKSHDWPNLQRLFTGLKMLITRAVTTVISSISRPLHFTTFSLEKLAALCYCGPTEHEPILLRAIALSDSTCSESTLLNALKQDCIFLKKFVCLFVIFSWFCYVAG